MSMHFREGPLDGVEQNITSEELYAYWDPERGFYVVSDEAGEERGAILVEVEPFGPAGSVLSAGSTGPTGPTEPTGSAEPPKPSDKPDRADKVGRTENASKLHKLNRNHRRISEILFLLGMVSYIAMAGLSTELRLALFPISWLLLFLAWWLK